MAKLFEGVHSRMSIEQLRSDLVLITVSGTDVFEFGDAPIREIMRILDENGPIDVFADVRDVRGASIEASGAWAVWALSHRAQFRDIRVLTGSRLVQITIDFVRRFAGLDGVMKIYTDAAAFDGALALSLAEH